MWNPFLTPFGYWALVIDVVSGFIISAFSRGPARFFLAWLLAPLVAAAVYTWPHLASSSMQGEASGWWMLAGVVAFVQGVFACGLGSLLCCLVRRKKTGK